MSVPLKLDTLRWIRVGTCQTWEGAECANDAVTIDIASYMCIVMGVGVGNSDRISCDWKGWKLQASWFGEWLLDTEPFPIKKFGNWKTRFRKCMTVHIWTLISAAQSSCIMFVWWLWFHCHPRHRKAILMQFPVHGTSRITSVDWNQCSFDESVKRNTRGKHNMNTRLRTWDVIISSNQTKQW